MGWWEYFDSFFDLLDTIEQAIWSDFIQPLIDAIKSPFEAVSNFFHQVFTGIPDAVNQHIFFPLQHYFGPLWVLVAIFITGLTVYVIIWVIDQILNLL